MAETSFNYLTSDAHAVFSTDEPKWVRKIMSLAKTHPEEVKIIHTPTENNEVLDAYVPKSWFKLSPPKKVTLTDEQRAAAAERMANARKNKRKE